MNKKNIFCIALLAVFAGGCATTSDMQTLQRQIRMVNKKLEDMKANTVEQLQKRQATASGHMDQMEQDIVQLRSQIEESYYLNQRLREQNKELQSAISNVAEQESAKREEALQALLLEQKDKENKIKELDDMLRKQDANVKAIQTARIREAERKAKEAALEAELAQQRKTSGQHFSGGKNSSRAIQVTRKKVKRKVSEQKNKPQQSSASQSTTAVAATQVNTKTVKKAETPASTPPKTQTAKPKPQISSPQAPSDSIFSKGKRLYQQKKYQEAFKVFEKLAKSPQSKDQTAARFMMGETQFAQKKYDLAVVHYQTVVTKSPGSAMAPEALIRQAQAFEKLADKETAKLVYSKIVKRYAKSPQAAQAQQRLSTL